MTVTEQALRYLAKCDAAISGQGGHAQAFHVACVLVQEFGLSVEDARPLYEDWNRTCQPPWNEKEIIHKLRDAERAPAPPEGRGYRVKRGVRHTFKDAPAPKPAPARPVEAKKPAAKKYEPAGAAIPEPIQDGARELLRAAFEPGEGVRLAQAKFNDEGKEIPKDGGITLSREEWLKKLDANGGEINKTLRTSDRNGIYVTVNPMKIGGNKDSDVTQFRHTLVEWDDISKDEQWNIITQSNIPCTAVIDSGGKSLHAWVRVDAADRREFDERVRSLYQHFEVSGCKLDDKNKNPSRLSRLAACERGRSRQELLALRIGAESWSQWVKEQETADLPQGYTLEELRTLDTRSDPNCVIGFRDGRTLRYLCREKSAWIIGPSGIGKSTLTTEFAVGWALGKPVFGITPARPLKSLIIQAENDKYDLAEMIQGVIKAHNLTPEFDPDDEYKAANKRIIIQSEDTSVGFKFIDRLHRFIDRDRPDIVWVDPLLSFAGIDVNKQDQVSAFLREGINPVLKATGAVMIGIHHTGKMRNSKKDMEQWSPLDFAYAGLGSSELVNWARAVMTLVPIDGDAYRLELAKRGLRAGATHPDGQWAGCTVYLKHSKTDIRWEQIQGPERPETSSRGAPQKKEKKGKMCDRIAAFNTASFIAACRPEGEGVREIAERLELWLSDPANKTDDLSSAGNTVCVQAINCMIANRKLRKTGSGKKVSILKGENA
jgi:RecA-family ATPase